jgi:hypothetical protein
VIVEEIQQGRMAVIPFELTTINLSTEDQNSNDLFSEVSQCFLAHRTLDPYHQMRLTWVTALRNNESLKGHCVVMSMN